MCKKSSGISQSCPVACGQGDLVLKQPSVTQLATEYPVASSGSDTMCKCTV